MLYIVIAVVGMWLFKRHSKGEGVKSRVDTSRVKQLSYEWEGLSNELALVQHAFEVEQIAYSNAYQILADKRLSVAYAFAELNDMKMELNNCLRAHKIEVEVFKELTDDCIDAYVTYERDQQELVDMEQDFSASYDGWGVKCGVRLTKMREMRKRIKEIEMEIKTLCCDV
jgi:hypothetical protein